MNRTWILAAALLGLLTLAFSQKPDSEKRTMNAGEKQIIHLEQEMAQAALRRDAAVYERMMADDFIGVDHLGNELNKAQIVARANVTDFELESLVHENIRVHVFADCAVATARTVMKGRYKGQDVSGVFPYMRFWLKRNGRWQAIATQSTQIPKP